SAEMERQYLIVVSELREAQAVEDAITRVIDDPRLSAPDKVEIRTKLNQAREMIRSRTAMLQLLDEKSYTIPKQPGFFRAVVPQFDPKLERPAGASKWTVLNDGPKETLYGRTVRPKEELLRVANLEGNWEVELKIPAPDVGPVLRAFAEPDSHKLDKAGRKYLGVDVFFDDSPGTAYPARLNHLAADVTPADGGSVLLAHAMLDPEDFPAERPLPREQLLIGREVRCAIRGVAPASGK